MISLIQKNWFTKEEFYLKKDRIVIISSNWDIKTERFIKFEDIGFDIIRKHTKRMLWLVILHFSFTCLFLYLLFDEYTKGASLTSLLAITFGALFFGACAYFSCFPKLEVIYLEGGRKTIKLDATKPNKKIVDKFIEDLYVAIKLFYKRKHGRVDLGLSDEDNVYNFKWLQNIGAINDIEYDQLVREIKINNLL